MTNATRTKYLHLLTISDMCKGSKSYTLFFKSLLKQSRPGFLCGQLELFAYPPDRRLCVVLVLKEYLERTKNLRGSCTDLFISYAETFAKFYKRPIKKDAELYQHAILKHWCYLMQNCINMLSWSIDVLYLCIVIVRCIFEHS